MFKWLLVALLAGLAHFGASYLVPLEVKDQGAIGGLLRWVWPWSVGDSGFLGQVSAGHLPVVGFWIAMTGAVLSALAALAALGIWLPGSWWRGLAVAGAVLLLVLMAGFLGPTKLVPILAAGLVIVAAAGGWQRLQIS